MNVLAIDRNSEEESRKLFRYIDYSNDGVIHKNQLKLFVAFIEGENPALPIIRPLKQMIADATTINEDLFV